MRLRFRHCSDFLSGMIARHHGETHPFAPTHVDLVLDDGYLGAHDHGIAFRPVGYDKVTLVHELFVDVPLPDEAAAQAFALSKVGCPYDWEAILDFVLPIELHEPRHLICSAFARLTLEAGGFFPYPLAVPAHATSPRDLLFLLSACVDIPEIGTVGLEAMNEPPTRTA